MKKILTNNRAEGHIDTGVKIIIAVVIGALILGGLYLLFAGNNGIFDKLNNKIYDMSNTGGEIMLKQDGDVLLYSYDENKWLEVNITGASDSGKVIKYITITNNGERIHFASVRTETGDVVYRSVDGKEWLPVRSGGTISILTDSGGTVIYVNYSDGRAYSSNDGLNWTLVSTKYY